MLLLFLHPETEAQIIEQNSKRKKGIIYSSAFVYGIS